MTLPPDKLFQQRLENYSKNPPARTWERIEAGLDKKKSNAGWMKVAASFLIIIIAATMIYYKSQIKIEVASTNSKSTQPLQEKNIIPSFKKSVSTITTQDPASATQPEEILHQNIAETRSKDIKDNSIPVQVIINKPEEDQTKQRSAEAVADNENSETINEESNPATVPETTVSTQIDVADNKQKPAGRKLMYSASDVHARFLKEKQSITLTPNEKPETGLEKIFDLTYSLKNGGTSLGHLRRLKNDFISNAFDNQKSEKQ